MSGPVSLSVRLLRHSADPEGTAALAARLCYSDAGIAELAEKVGSNEQRAFIEKIVSIGHHSVLEHVSFTFGIEGVSRALTHQLVRHRIASYSQKSQRYVTHEEGFPHIVPPSVDENPDVRAAFDAAMQAAGAAYAALVEAGIPAEDARSVLPNACETKIIVTMNARELIHFFRVRCCERAQWEIRAMAIEMLRLAHDAAPALFTGAGPGCLGGPCPEGKFTCGRPTEIREKFSGISGGRD